LSNWLLGIVLGFVQGISEWLPISSKTQVIFASTYFFGLTFSEAYAFGLFLEAGTFVAAVYYFRNEVWGVLRALVGKGNEEERRLLKFLVVVTAFTAIVGVVIYKFVSEALSGPVLGLPMVALGSILIGDGILISLAKGRFVPKKGLKDLRTRELVVLGIVQGVAALPGVSRSGATVSAMLLLGINPEDSFKLSFLALIPASLGAAGVTILFSNLQLGAVVSIVGIPVILIAILVSIFIGVVFIRLLLRFAGSRRIALLTISLGILAVFSGVASFLTGAG